MDDTSAGVSDPRKIKVYPRTIKEVALLYLDETRANAAKKTAIDAITDTKIADLLALTNAGAN